MDAALIDSILRHRLINLRYTIIRSMLTIPNIKFRSLPYCHFITRLLKYFRVPINEPSCNLTKCIGDEAVCALGFEWHNGAWMKFKENKYTFLAPSDDRPLNAVVLVNQLSNFSRTFKGQHRDPVPPVSVPAPDASASIVPPSEPHDSEVVTLQQLMDKVKALSVEQ